MISDPLFYLAAIAAVTALGLSKGGFSGIGQIATPLLALFLPPLQAAALLLPIMIAQDAVSVWVYRRDWDAHNLKIMLPGAVVGICAAWMFAAHFSDAMVRIAVGVISLTFVLGAWFRWRAPTDMQSPSPLRGAFWGGVSGFTSTLCQAGGPPYQMHVLPQRLAKMTFVGTTAIYFAAVNALKVVPYFALGQFSPENLATSAALLPLAIVTSLLGVWLVRRTPTVLFYKIAHVLVFLIALELIRAGAVGMLQG